MMAERKPSRQVTVAPGVRLPAGALRLTFARSGGPGGQHANKASTQVTLTVPLDALAEAMPPDAIERLTDQAGHFLATDRLVISSADSRSQQANRRACMTKLRDLLVRASHRPKRRRPTRPSRGAVERRIEAKKQRGDRKAARRQNRDASDT